MCQVLDGDKIVIYLFKSNSILIDHIRDGQLLESITKKELGWVLSGAKLWTKSRVGLPSTRYQVIQDARYAMVDGNTSREPVPIETVKSWLDAIEKA